jgi:cell wall-associated NlpC family hydrolase
MEVTLTSVSLFNGAVTASSVQARNGSGTVSGLEIDGSTISATAAIVPLGSWGQLTLGDTLGRLRAPLMLRLFQARDSLPAGTTIAVGFAAAPRHVPKRTKENIVSSKTSSDHTANGSTKTKKEHRQQPSKPPPDYPAAADPFAPSGGLTDAAKDNAVVSVALRYLGVRYQWGGASPKTGFDCSGLVMYVFAKLGVSLAHFAASQYYSPDAVYVAPQRLQAGDLVFFTGSDGTRKEPGHVGIYVGDGYLIDAPHTGSFVRYDKLTEPKLANEYVGAKRIVSRLVLAHHLLNVSRRGASATGTLLGFPLMTDGPLSGSRPYSRRIRPQRGLHLAPTGCGSVSFSAACSFRSPSQASSAAAAGHQRRARTGKPERHPLDAPAWRCPTKQP